MNQTKSIPLNNAKTGNLIGNVAVTRDEYAWIESRAQRGIFRADSLAPEEWTRLGIAGSQLVYFDGTFETTVRRKK